MNRSPNQRCLGPGTVAWTNTPGFAISPNSRWLLYASLESSDADLMLVDHFR
jgi:hypothetical protein